MFCHDLLFHFFICDQFFSYRISIKCAKVAIKYNKYLILNFTNHDCAITTEGSLGCGTQESHLLEDVRLPTEFHSGRHPRVQGRVPKVHRAQQELLRHLSKNQEIQ